MAHKGRIALQPDPETWLRHVLKENAFRSAVISDEVAILSRTLAVPHEDPADRFLAATAAVYDLTLLTADTRLLEGSGYSVVSNDG